MRVLYSCSNFRLVEIQLQFFLLFDFINLFVQGLIYEFCL